MITLAQFFDEYYKQQAQNSNYQSIASYVDGLKPTARKVIHTVLKNNLNVWTKVEGLANRTAGETEYLGGATNISGVINTISKGYVTSNNIPMMETLGNFGQRLDNKPGEPRYIKVRKLKDMDYYFNKEDSKILIEQIFEGTKIEPRFFIPNLPFLLINGSEGIGSGHAQAILPRNPETIKQYIKSYLNGDKTPELIPYWKGFKGEVKQGENNKKWSTFGVFEVSKRLITITELPVGYSLSKYLKILDNLVDKKIIKKYDDLSDTKSDTYKFIVQVDMNFEMTKENIIDKLNLESKFSENYTSIDENNSIVLFDTIEDILNAYIKIKLDFMKIRKENIINNINKSVIIARNKMLFVKGIVTEKFTINKKSKDDINDLLKLEKFDLVDDSYDYLLNMNLYSLTKERIISLKNTQDSLENELNIITGTSESDMWISEI